MSATKLHKHMKKNIPHDELRRRKCYSLETLRSFFSKEKIVDRLGSRGGKHKSYTILATIHLALSIIPIYRDTQKKKVLVYVYDVSQNHKH